MTGQSLRAHRVHWLRVPQAALRMMAVALPLLVPGTVTAQGSEPISYVDGRRFVPENKMQCTTMVSPNYPIGFAAPERRTELVTLRILVSVSGAVQPLEIISGLPNLQDEAKDAVRLWHYRPFVLDDKPIEVVTDARVQFSPDSPGGLITHPSR